MSKFKRFNHALFTVFLSFLNLPLINAGTTCKDIYANRHILQNASLKAEELKLALDQSNAKAALIARVGADVRKYGLYFTHAAFTVKNFTQNDNQWTVIHLINPCGTASSHIEAQALKSFFMDDLFNNDYEIIVPAVTTQNKIITALKKTESKKIHNPRYSMIAHPFSRKFQNSNQWIIELIAAAETGHYTRKNAQYFLKKTHFKPSLIRVSLLEKIGISLFKKHISFRDHPKWEHRTNRYSVVTVDSVIKWLKRNHQLKSVRQYIA